MTESSFSGESFKTVTNRSSLWLSELIDYTNFENTSVVVYHWREAYQIKMHLAEH